MQTCSRLRLSIHDSMNRYVHCPVQYHGCVCSTTGIDELPLKNNLVTWPSTDGSCNAQITYLLFLKEQTIWNYLTSSWMDDALRAQGHFLVRSNLFCNILSLLFGHVAFLSRDLTDARAETSHQPRDTYLWRPQNFEIFRPPAPAPLSLSQSRN